MSYDSSGHSKGGRIVTSSQVGMVNAASQGSVGAGGSVIEPVDADLESARNLFEERVKELSAAVAKVDTLTRQLEELRKGNASNSYHVTCNNGSNNSNTIKFNQEFEKLRQELLYRSRLVQNQSTDLESKESLLNQKKSELVVIDEKIAQLQQRLAKKRHINQQLSYQMQSTQAALSGPGIGLNNQFNTLRGTSSHSYKRLPINQQRSTVPNIAAVEPIQRLQQPQSAVDPTEVNLKEDVTLCMYSKNDPKYQTLPPNTKFNRNGLELIPDANVPGRIGGSGGGSLRVKDGVYCARDEGMVMGSGGELKDVSSQSPSSSTPTIDSAPEDGPGSLRIVTSSESGVGSSISSGCSFQSNSINLMNGYKTLYEDVAGNREGELRARGINLPITISLNPSWTTNTSGTAINTTTQQQHTLQPLNNGNNLGAASVEKKGLSDYSLRVPSSSSTSSAPTSSFSTTQQNSIISTLSSDHTIAKNNNDWQKSRRRPVVVDDEDMERQLSAPDSDVIELTQKHFPIETRKSSITTHSPKENIQSHHQPIVKSVTGNSSPIKISHDCGRCGEESDSLSSVTCDVTDDSFASFSWNQVVPHLEKVVVVEKTIESLNAPVKQQKDGGHDQSKVLLANEVECVSKKKSGLLKNNQKGLTRRVSFDPLALLLDAALEGELELVKKTASQVPDPSAVKDEGITALHNAICAGHFPIVRFLVEIACDVNAQDSDGWTPLHCAASCNNLAMVRLLVQNGACIFATTFSDYETAAEKCEEDEVGFDECYRYLSGVQEEMGIRNERVVYAVYDYDAQNSDEMSFKDGDRVSTLRRGDDQEVDWWWARSENGTEGYVPRNLFGLYPRVKPKQRSEPQEK